MKANRLSIAVPFLFLALGGMFAFSPLEEAVSRNGHQFLWVVEAAWFGWENLRKSGSREPGHSESE
jgi:hypothetical protein